jgi:hypothetical protein
LGTCLRPNGVHAVVEACADGSTTGAQLADIGNAELAGAPLRLERMGLSTLNPVVFKAADHRYRLGVDILPRGDFESEGLYGTSDRTFIRDASAELVDGESRALRVEVPAGETARTGMKVFERVFSASNPTTLAGKVRASADITLEVRLQRRRQDESLDEALANDTARVVGRYQVPAGGWKSFAVDFDQPRVSTRSVRLLFDISSATGPAEVFVDDLAWVEWRTPWLDGDAEPGDPIFATHVQFQLQ